MPGHTGPLYFAIALQYSGSNAGFGQAWRGALAVLLCGWVVLIGTLALNDAWHERLHAWAGDPPASEGSCAVELFAHGGVAPGLEFPPVSVAEWVGVEFALPQPIVQVHPRRLLQVGHTRGPPFRG